MASAVDIANSALNLLGASTISAFTDDSKNARLVNQRYEPVRDRVFRSHAWNCLHKRVELAQNSTAPVVEYSFAYSLPSDCLRVLKIHNGATDSIVSEMEYKIEGRNIVTNEKHKIFVSSSNPEVVETIPGWAHDIKNIGDEEMIVMIWANEVFDLNRPDTFYSNV